MKHIKIFLASPGDVADERAIALKVISDLQFDPLLRGKVTTEAVAWDGEGGPPMEASLKPQEAIIKGLPLPSQCEIFIAMFWSRMGTPTEVDGRKYLSGTEYEFNEALEGNKANGTPRVLAYRCTKKLLLDADETDFQKKADQYQKVKNFFSQFNDKNTGEALKSYATYDTPNDLKKRLEYDLKSIINELVTSASKKTKKSSDRSSKITKVGDSIKERQWIGSPFPGLRAFQIKDEPIYFGRGRELDILIDIVRNNKFIAVVGASGSGKSSLVGAGILPRLENTSTKSYWMFIVLTPDYLGSGDPFSSLALSVISNFNNIKSQQIVHLMQADTKQFILLLKKYISSKKHTKLLIFIDQFEEIFTTVKPEYRKSFVQLINDLIQADFIKVIITLRGDFYGTCLDMPLLANLLENSTFPLSSPNVVSLHEMINKPALRAGLEFEPGLVEQILEDTGLEPGALALMAYSLDELYRKSSKNNILTYYDYNALGRVQGAIGKRAEAIYNTLDPEAKSFLPHVFKELIEIDERGVATRRREALSKVARSEKALVFVNKMTSERLLVQSQGENNTPYVEVAHEALLRSWIRLADWIKVTEEDLRLLRQVRNAAREWDENQQKDSFLWPHERLDPVYLMQKNLNVEFDDVTSLFVKPEIERLSEEWKKPSVRSHRRLSMIDRFVSIGSSTVALLVEALQRDLQTKVRSAIITALGNIGDASASSALLKVMQERQHARITNPLIVALGKLQSKEAIPMLLSFLDWRDDYKIYLKESEARRKGGRNYVYQPNFHEGDTLLHIRATITALGRIRDESTVDALIDMLHYPNEEIVKSSATALQKIGTDKALTAVKIWKSKKTIIS